MISPANRVTCDSLLAAFTAQTDDQLFALDPEGHLLICNTATARFLGLSPEAAQGKRLEELLPPDQAAAIRQNIARVCATGTSVVCEDTVRHTDGGDRHFSTRYIPLRDPDGLIHAVAGLGRDMTTFKKAKRRLREVLEATHEGHWSWDLRSGVAELSPQYWAMSGYTEGEVTPDLAFWHRLIHPDDLDEVMATTEAHLRGETEKCHIEHRLVRKSGEVCWVSGDGRVVERGPDGAPLRMVGVINDITGRKQQALMTEERERRYRQVLEITQEAIWDIDMRSGLVTHNPRWNELLDLHDDLLEHPLALYHARIHPDDRARMQGIYDRAIREGSDYQGTYRLRHAGGHTLWVEDHGRIVARDAGGTPLRMLGAFTDITTRIEQDNTIRRLSSAMEQSPVAIAITDTEAAIVYVNKTFCRNTGYHADELIGNTHSAMKSGKTPAETYQHLWQTLNSGNDWNGEFLNRKKDGTLYWVQATIAPLTDCVGTITHYLAITQDITEKRQMIEQLTLARNAAESANRAKNEFLSTMSHELRTPMNSIIGMAQLMEFTNPNEEQREYLNAINSSSKSLLALINDILDLSRIDVGKIELEPTDFSLRRGIDEIIRSQSSLARRKNLSLDTDIPESVPDQLTGDQLRLKQILLNLLGNAIKFTKSGGVRLSVTLAERHGDRALLQIAVTDSGIGMGPALLKKIFDPFVQGDSSSTRNYGGAGVGLALCTRLTQLMGGNLRAESTEGVGSTFFVQLPFTVREVTPVIPERQSGGRTPSTLWQGPPLRVLLVDDQELNLLLVKRLLQKAGHTVSEAGDGREALEKWEGGEFDLILMDIQMPGMGGIEATGIIREKEGDGDRHIPIIALTAHALREDEMLIMSHGFDGYLAKPIQIDTLFAEMQRCLPGGGTRAGAENGEPPQELPAAATGAIDRERLATLLGELKEMLEVGSMAAMEKSAELGKLVPRSPSIESFVHHVKQFDFDGALGCLEGIRREFEIQDPAR